MKCYNRVFQFLDAGASLQAGSLSIMMLLGFSFLTTSFVLFVVEERENKVSSISYNSHGFES